MKPLKIEFQAFGPYAGYEMVDFGAIASKGLFLICGKTGIGKTMIIDAMTFALFGKSSGNGRNDLEAMRCTNAAFDATTFVRFEFENNGKYYLFERRLERKRKNLSASYNVAEKGADGVWKPIMENPKEKALNEKAVEIIGLEYGQFRQVIVLPQGQFEKLLTSPSDEKEKILISIFGEEKWQQIADRFYAKAESRKNSLKEVREKIRISLSEEGCESLSQLELMVKNKQGEEKALDNDNEKEDHDGIIKAQQEILSVIKRFEDLHKAERTVKKLEEEKAERELWEKEAGDAKRAETVKPLLDTLRSTFEAYEKRRAEEETAKKAEAGKMKAAEKAAEKLKSHLEKEKEIEDLKSKRIRYEGKRDDYAGIDEAENKLNEGKKKTADALSQEESVRMRSDAVSKEIIALKNDYRRLESEHGELLNRYLSGITGELAASLKDGEPCPVCGSTEHPNKACSADNSTTRAMVDRKKKECDKKYLELQERSDELEKLKKLEKEKHDALERSRMEEAAFSAELEEKKKNLIEGISALEELEDVIEELADSIEAYEKLRSGLFEEEKKAKEAYTEARTQTAASLNECKNAKKKYDEALKAVEKGLKDNGFKSEEEAQKLMLTTDELNNLTSRMAAYDADVRSSGESLEALKKELKDIEEPDEEKCREALDNAEKARAEYIRKKAVLSKEIERLSDKLKDLKAKDEGMDERIREADEDFAFAKKLRGDSGTGLQRYVLGIMFSSVIAEANKMLEMVHGGRYRLFRSDDKVQGTNKRGLELKVYDKYSGEHEGRSVSTLSGGEKFLASLALSIGMSTIAQKKGIRIDALFIDEGFGSLDDESIEDAMNVLNSIQEANGLVGIISHVQILQDQIPAKLRIIEDDYGSHIVESIG